METIVLDISLHSGSSTQSSSTSSSVNTADMIHLIEKKELGTLLSHHCTLCTSVFGTVQQLQVHGRFMHPTCTSSSLCEQDVKQEIQSADAYWQEPGVQYALLCGMKTTISSGFTPMGYAKLQVE